MQQIVHPNQLLPKRHDDLVQLNPKESIISQSFASCIAMHYSAKLSDMRWLAQLKGMQPKGTPSSGHNAQQMAAQGGGCHNAGCRLYRSRSMQACTGSGLHQEADHHHISQSKGSVLES